MIPIKPLASTKRRSFPAIEQIPLVYFIAIQSKVGIKNIVSERTKAKSVTLILYLMNATLASSLFVTVNIFITLIMIIDFTLWLKEFQQSLTSLDPW